ncbi:MAG: DUF1640 domain-containing protein [Methylococcales bacterium]|jgi:hypothetical protein|nr:DUF1640 domain-containing protein [Methylococcales bacterium]MBT7409331.1 DUF1640 domain-containing protein [Methylococcales bacterium]
MTTITFDTLQYSKKLTDAGASQELAEAMAEAQKVSLSEILDTQLATKQDVQKVEEQLAKITVEMKLTRWMVGLSIALSIGVISLLIKIALKILL